MDRASYLDGLDFKTTTLVVLLTIILIFTAIAQTGAASIERDEIEKFGGLEAELRPDFKSVSYTVDEKVFSIERFEDESDFDLKDGYLESGRYYHEDTTYGAEFTTDDIVLSTSEHPIDGITFSWRTKMTETAENDCVLFEYDMGDTFVKIDFMGGTYPPRLNVDGLGHDTAGHEEDYEIGTAYRYVLETTDEGTVIFSVHDDTEEIGSVRFEDAGVTPQNGERVILAGESTFDGYTSHLFTADGGYSQQSIYEPSDRDFQVTDAWNPAHTEESSNTEINYDEMVYAGESGGETTHEAFGITDLKSPNVTTSSINAEESMHYLAQQSEEYDRIFTGDTYFQGWNSLNNAIIYGLMEFAHRVHNTDDITDVTVIDYHLQDLAIRTRYEESKREDIREAYAESVLEVAESREWDIWAESLSAENDSGWRSHTDYEDVWYQFGDTGIRGDIKEDIITGRFGVAIPDEDDPDFSEIYKEIAAGLKEESVQHFALYEGTVADISNYWQSHLGSNSYDGDRYLTETRHFQATNLALANTLLANETTMNDVMRTVDRNHTLEISLRHLQENIEVDYGNRMASVFNFLARDADGNLLGRASDTPLTVSTTTASTSYTFHILLLVLVGVTAFAFTYFRKVKKGGASQNAKERK